MDASTYVTVTFWLAVAVLMAWCHHLDPARRSPRGVYIPQPCPRCGWEDCRCERSSES